MFHPKKKKKNLNELRKMRLSKQGLITCDVPNDFIGEHFLGLSLPQRIKVPTGTKIDGVSDDVLGGQSSTQPRQKRVVKTT